MRFGLVGTGPWASKTHGPGLAAADGIDLVGVWGRNREKARALAGSLGVAAYDDYDALLADVDAVAFAVPPDVQAELALVAARAGKHLLLDKPVALDVAAARALSEAAAESGVSSVVFFTDRFVDTARQWFERVQAVEGWRGGWLRWFSALHLGSAWDAGSWREKYGALWDTGPHAVSTLTAALGPVTSLTAVPRGGDLVTLVLRHEGGATSNVQLTQFAPAAAVGFSAGVWGEAGFEPMPPRPEVDIDRLLAVAAGELVRSAQTGEPHPLDLRFGLHVVELLADGQAQLSPT